MRYTPLRYTLLCSAIVLFMISAAEARDCSLGKQFEIKRLQALSGRLEDSAGAALAKTEVELLSKGKTVRKVMTDDEGRYDLGEVQPGKYQLRLVYLWDKGRNKNQFCAPDVHCARKTACSISQKVRLQYSPD